MLCVIYTNGLTNMWSVNSLRGDQNKYNEIKNVMLYYYHSYDLSEIFIVFCQYTSMNNPGHPYTGTITTCLIKYNNNYVQYVFAMFT